MENAEIVSGIFTKTVADKKRVKHVNYPRQFGLSRVLGSVQCEAAPPKDTALTGDTSDSPFSDL